MIKNGFRLVLESEKVVLTKDGMYVGRGYMTDGLFKLNVLTVVPTIASNNKNSSFAYIVDSSHLWHSRLRHVNYGSLCTLVNLECLPKFNLDPNHKCEVCFET